MGRVTRLAARATLLLALMAGNVGAQPTRVLVERARQYVAEYDRALAALLADERYVQTLAGDSDADAGTRRRVLESEFGWVPIPTLGDTVGVREVQQVDGRVVASGGRLRAMLQQPRRDPLSEVRAILAESASHNLGPLRRNFNFPTFPLAYLRQGHGSQIRWKVDRDGALITLTFRERDRPTVVRTAEGLAVRARGQFTIDPDTGRILACQVHLPDIPDAPSQQMEYRLAVTFGEDRRLSLWVPVRMTEQYRRKGVVRAPPEIVGEAIYGNYRRYEGSGRLITPGL